jgi:hypothetical protein
MSRNQKIEDAWDDEEEMAQLRQSSKYVAVPKKAKEQKQEEEFTPQVDTETSELEKMMKQYNLPVSFGAANSGPAKQTEMIEKTKRAMPGPQRSAPGPAKPVGPARPVGPPRPSQAVSFIIN